MFECAHCPEDEVMCRNQQALSFDMRYQYPDGPVCDWPSNVDCDHDGNEHHYVTIESTTTQPSKTTQASTTSTVTYNPGEECLPYDGSRVPDCREFIDPLAKEPYYHYHSTSNIAKHSLRISCIFVFFRLQSILGMRP